MKNDKISVSYEPKAKSSKSHKTPASSSSSTTPSMTGSSLPVSTQAPVTSSHHSTSTSSTPNSQTNVVRYECARSLNRWFSRFHYFLTDAPRPQRTYRFPLIIFPRLPIRLQFCERGQVRDR